MSEHSSVVSICCFIGAVLGDFGMQVLGQGFSFTNTWAWGYKVLSLLSLLLPSPLSSPLPSPPLSLLPLSSLLNLTCAKEHWPDNGNAKMPAMNIVIKFPKAQTDPIWFYQGTFSAHSRFIASMCNIVGVGVMARMFQMIRQSQWDLDNMRVIPAQHRESTDRLSCKGSLAGTC